MNVEIAHTFPVAMLPVEVTTCADSVCNTGTYPAGSAEGQTTFIVGGMVILNETHERDVAVTIKVKSTKDGKVLWQAAGPAHLRRLQPNGPGCGPVCYSAVLTDTEGGGLVQS